MDFEAALRRWVASQRCVCIAGAGISVASGIPDFRSRDGIYQLIAACSSGSAASFSEPQEIFDAAVFHDEPELLYAMAPMLFAPLWAAKPSGGHRFLAALCRLGRLQRLYSQNVDGLEVQAGIAVERLVLCHGTLSTASCMRCGRKISCAHAALRSCLEAGTVATCRATGGSCPEAHQTDDGWVCGARKRGPNSRFKALPLPILKPDAVFFREPLPPAFHAAVAQDFRSAATAAVADSRTSTAAETYASPDACLVIGSRLAVRPVADLPHLLPPSCWKVLINRERLLPAGSRVDAEGCCLPAKAPAVAAVGSKRARKADVSGTSASAASTDRPVPPAFDAEFIGEADVITHMLLQVLQAEIARTMGGDAGSSEAAHSSAGAASSPSCSGGSDGAALTAITGAASAHSDDSSPATASAAATRSDCPAPLASLGSLGFVSMPAPPGHWHVHGHGACVRDGGRGGDGDGDGDGRSLSRLDSAHTREQAAGCSSKDAASSDATATAAATASNSVFLVQAASACAAADAVAAAAPQLAAAAGSRL